MPAQAELKDLEAVQLQLELLKADAPETGWLQEYLQINFRRSFPEKIKRA